MRNRFQHFLVLSLDYDRGEPAPAIFLETRLSVVDIGQLNALDAFGFIAFTMLAFPTALEF